MLVGKYFLVSRAQVAHHLVVHRFDMSVQVRPAVAGYVTTLIGTVVSQQQNRVVVNFQFLVLDAQCIVVLLEVGLLEVLEALGRVIRENDER